MRFDVDSMIALLTQVLRPQLIETGKQVAETGTDSDIVSCWVCYGDYVQEKQHNVGDVVRDKDGTLWVCDIAYDGSVQKNWNLSTPSLWHYLHGISKETAFDWKQPTHAENRYLLGEFMTYTDGLIYECVAANGTDRSPEDHPAGWKLIKED